jgi:hypothetical protein
MEQYTPSLCPVCGGDARASVGCKACRGAGVSLSTERGQLVWLEKVDSGTFAVRRRGVLRMEFCMRLSVS